MTIPENSTGYRYMTITYGCQMNLRDTETMEALLNQAGYQQVFLPTEADVIVVNTCSVRHSAENKVYGKLGELNKLKNQHPDLLVVVSGCMSQLEENQKRLKRAGVDLVVGTHNLTELPPLLDKARQQKRTLIEVWNDHGPVVEGLPPRKVNGISAFINVMYGCNNYCSYCIVPYTRGRERSREPESIVEEVKQLVDQGVKEVTLLGQNVNSYGKGLERSFNFADLLTLVDRVEGLERIRFTTSHPKDMSDNLLDAVATLPRVCEHIHAPIQSGSDRILKAMNRHYTRDDYLTLASKIRAKIPGVALTSDLIVGFPGESADDFAATLDIVNEVGFDAAFTFIFSPRRGTKAAEMAEQLSWEEKRNRLIELNQVQYQLALSKNQALEGTVQEILVEGASKTDALILMGRTRTNRIVNFAADATFNGQVVNVKIIKGKTFNLEGSLLD